MKITKRKLRRIIKEEKAKLVEYGDYTRDALEPRFPKPDKKKHAGNLQDVAAAQEKIEEILNTLYDNGVENDGLKALLNNIIRDIDEGFVGEPT
jgi:hypothetical protein